MEERTILIVEDEPKIIEVISSYVANAGYRPITAANGKEALHYFKTESIDLILLDLMLPDLSGESICNVIRKTSKVPIIMITAKSDEENIIAGLNMGADDYITKPFSPRQLMARINALFRRSILLEQKLINTIGPFRIKNENYSIIFNNQDLQLTPTEYSLLKILLARPSKVFTRDELVTIVFEDQYIGYNRSIDSHIKNIRSKIGQYSNFNYIKTVHGIGYQYNQEESCE